MEILIVAVLIGLIPAFIAKNKGKSFALWWVYGAAIFIVALPHALIMTPEPGSEEALKREALRKNATGEAISPTEFVADGVISGDPYRTDPDGGVVGIINGRTIKFRRLEDLQSMVDHNSKGA